MQSEDLVTWRSIIKKSPLLLMNSLQIMEGVKLTRLDNPSTPVGLALEFESAAVDNAKGVALLSEGQRITYSQANKYANQIAHGLKDLGLQKGDVIGLYMGNRPETLLLALACAKIGAIAAMLNTQKTKALLMQSIKLISPKFMVVGEEVTQQFLSLPEHIDSCERLLYLPDTPISIPTPNTQLPDFLAQMPYHTSNLYSIILHLPQTNLDSSKKIYLHDPLFYIFTSGTSGLPKAGIFTHGRWMKVFGGIGKLTTALKQDDVLYATMPLYHATALCVCWCSVIAARAGFAIGRKFSASQFWQETIRFHATAMGYVGDLCQFLLAQAPKEADQQHHVRIMLGNGLRPAIWSKFKSRFQIKTVYEFYGASDGNVGFFNVLNLDYTVGFSPNRFALIAVDENDHTPIRGQNGFFIRVKAGETGLLISEISTHFPLDGYTEKHETEKLILKNSFETGDRWLNTGDLMRDLGFRHTQFVDRVGDSYRWHGENISTQEVENVALEHAFVDQAIVYGVKVPASSGKAGMLTMSLANKLNFSVKKRRQFLAYLRTHLPSYAVPRFLRITSGLNTTSTFKFKKRKYQNEGYNPNEISDELYIYDLHSNTYKKLSPEIYSQLETGDYKL